ncbi:MAG: hypothetical protein SGPRY_003187 [Prymnesium sp.]
MAVGLSAVPWRSWVALLARSLERRVRRALLRLRESARLQARCTRSPRPSCAGAAASTLTIVSASHASCALAIRCLARPLASLPQFARSAARSQPCLLPCISLCPHSHANMCTSAPTALTTISISPLLSALLQNMSVFALQWERERAQRASVRRWRASMLIRAGGLRICCSIPSGLLSARMEGAVQRTCWAHTCALTPRIMIWFAEDAD